MSGDPGTVALNELHGALVRLDLRLHRVVASFREELDERVRDPFRGLYISDADVDELLGEAPSADAIRHLDDVSAGVIMPRLGRLGRLLGLTDFEQEVLLICLAPEVDLRYERLYAYLQDDVTRRRPTVDLILRLLATSFEERVAMRQALGPTGRLFTSGVLVLSDDAAAHWPLLSRPLRVDERIVEYLLGSDAMDPRIAGFSALRMPDSEHDAVSLPAEIYGNLMRLVSADRTTFRQGPIIYLHGAIGTAKLTIAKVACARAGCPLLQVDLAALLASEKPAPPVGLVLAAREALLRDAVLVLDGFDELLDDEPSAMATRWRLREILVERAAPTLLIGEARWEPSTWLPGVTGIRIELPKLDASVRLRLWQGALDGHLRPEDVTGLAERFRLDVDGIQSVKAAAQVRSIWRGNGAVALEDYRGAAQAIASPPLDGLARRIEPRYGWDDIVLTPDNMAQLRELCDRARYQVTVLDKWGFGRKHARRSGLTVLFAGQPGTGKTMAAEIVAGALGLDLYRIDLASVVSKYIGETEKNLERIFRAADLGDAVLLFDEADAIFGKRSEVRDAHDRYANVETAYLLQRLENYDGLAILTTNLRGNIDEAFVRRLDFVLEFPLPDEAERLAIWRLAIPPEAPLAPDADLEFLARKFRLAGGHIRNIALAAGFLAAAEGGAITMKHLTRATRREYQKIGKLVAEADFEQYYRLLKDD